MVAMSNDLIDAEGFRANVGIILVNSDDKLMLAGRAGAKGWQFPQGGMLQGEEPEQSMYRELHEEVGLTQADVELLGVTSDWLRYKLPGNTCAAAACPCVLGKNSDGSCCGWCVPRMQSGSIVATRLSLTVSAGSISGGRSTR